MVLGMRYDSSFDYAVAGLYRAAVAVSALILSLSVSAVYAADPPAPRSSVSVNVNPTTGYYSVTNSTLRLPNGVSASPAAGASTVTKYSGGLQQTIPTGITIDAIKKSAPLPVAVRASTPKLKTAAKGLFRGNLAGLVLGAGLQSLLDGIGVLIDEGGTVSRIEPVLPENSPNWCMNAPSDMCGPTPQGVFTRFVAREGRPLELHYDQPSRYRVSRPAESGAYAYIFKINTTCPAGYEWQPRPIDGCAIIEHSPMPLHDLDDAIDSSYDPEPSDWTNLTPHLDLDDVEITSAPTLQGEPKTITVYDADGNPHKVTQTNIWYDFDIRDNPSPRPALDMKTREETKTYEDGELTGTTTTESTASAGSGGTPPPESPIDCDLFPTACAWFDWTQEEPVEPDTDLSGLLQEVPIVSETYTITGGVAACPAPMVLDLSVFGAREVSYQPLCDLASTMKFLYLALMSFAAAVLLNRSINRV